MSDTSEPRPTLRWVVTCLVLGVLLTIAQSMVALGCAVILCVPSALDETDRPMLTDVGPVILLSCCGFYGAPLFGAFWTLCLLSFAGEFRDTPGCCSYCGWKLRIGTNNRCRICGAPAPGFCCRCGYDLTGNVSGTCPECGATIKGEEESA